MTRLGAIGTGRSLSSISIHRGSTSIKNHQFVYTTQRRDYGQIAQCGLRAVKASPKAVTTPSGTDAISTATDFISSCWNAIATGGTVSVVQSAFAGATVYALGVALFLLYQATVLPVQIRKRSTDGFVYSADDLKNSRKNKYAFIPPVFPLLMPLIAMYLFLLVQSYEPDMMSLILPGNLKDGFSNGFNPQFFPKVQGIATLFSRATTTASLWVHLLCVNIFSAHALLSKGVSMDIPTHHTVLIAMVFGPLGLLSHWMTSLVCSKSPKAS
jgi:hypothetical protein